MMEGELKHDIDKLIEELRFVVKSEKEIKDIIPILDSIVNVSKASIGEATDFTVDDVFLTLLHHESKEIVAKTAKAIAEIAKSEKGREKCTNIDLVTTLIDLLKEDRVDVLTQTSRALGNICYENENGKKFVEDKNGLMSILGVLEKSVALKDVEGAPFLRNVAAGLLLNFLIDRPSLYSKALEHEMVPIICTILETDGTAGGEAAMHALSILRILDDDSAVFLDERLTKILVNILTTDTSLELFEMCLEVLHGQAEDEKAKSLLARAGVCELLLKLLEKHSPYCTDEETRSVLKIACNLIVLVLTGDDSMNTLYDDSNGVVYKKLVEWLDSEDRDLQVTAVLAMGNFARTDAHCKLMVTKGVHCDLLKLLQENNTDAGDIIFQHALLSALRNLVIPADNKPVILKDGLINVLYSMLDIPSYPVVFKLLGTLRIVIDGQIQLLIFIFCYSRSKEIVFSIIQHGGVKHLVKMLTAPHFLMRNEALISLKILIKTCLTEHENLIEVDTEENQSSRKDQPTQQISVLQHISFIVDNITNSGTHKNFFSDLRKYRRKFKYFNYWNSFFTYFLNLHM
ncbi:Rap1 GTPase-GDP dissociation stimulator 1-B [Habropoda laboriosa]|uniref:Rap1 GTPase-GDP dissociation stimulator 1-B n=1 Tax=Habropoda laboriosa TaxID=597456 RepID=A0A0L7REF6_9HYME|nr:Rap1 GTPase-GDP dissociation stimulator 1-B [Habropoda laboriosa]